MLGSLLGGYYISAKGLRRYCLRFVVASTYRFGIRSWRVSSPIMVSLSLPPSYSAYFGYGFGFVGLMLFMMQQVAPGKHQMAHYAFASGIMNLGVMLPNDERFCE